MSIKQRRTLFLSNRPKYEDLEQIEVWPYLEKHIFPHTLVFKYFPKRIVFRICKHYRFSTLFYMNHSAIEGRRILVICGRFAPIHYLRNNEDCLTHTLYVPITPRISITDERKFPNVAIATSCMHIHTSTWRKRK